MIEKIYIDKKLSALILRKKKRPQKKGANFLTKNRDEIQLGIINYPKGHKIKGHYHITHKKIIRNCSEVLLIEKGLVVVNFFNKKNNQLNSTKKLYQGDIIILFSGGHSFEILKNAQIIEVKQGPYNKKIDKKYI